MTSLFVLGSAGEIITPSIEAVVNPCCKRPRIPSRYSLYTRRVGGFGSLCVQGSAGLSTSRKPTKLPPFSRGVIARTADRQAVIHLRARGRFPFFKLVLITNASGLDRPEVGEGLLLFTRLDEVWAKLDSGTQEYLNRVNRPNCSVEKVLANILNLARQRPAIDGQGPPASDIDMFAAAPDVER